MPLVRMKEKGQVTIPAIVREQIAAHKGDVFEVAVVDGDIVLKPRQLVTRTKPSEKSDRKGVDITRWIGAGKGLFKTPEEVDAFIRSERDRWD